MAKRDATEMEVILLEGLKQANCLFWACEGFNPPDTNCICHRCAAIAKFLEVVNLPEGMEDLLTETDA